MSTAAWSTIPPEKSTHFVKYVPVGYSDTHSLTVGYLFWLVGFTGAHRFYFGKPLTGILWFFTFGLLGVGWIIDLFLIPSMDRESDHRFQPGVIDYSLAWILLLFGGLFGLHRFYQGRWISGLLFLATGGLAGIGYVYDILTLNTQIDQTHRHILCGSW
jgi:TM2 domain-containing membrane protein YozV